MSFDDIAERDAHAMSMVCSAAMRRDPSLVPYCGPQDTLRAYQRGEIVTPESCLRDLSPWIIEAVHERTMVRLRWMLQNAGNGRGRGADSGTMSP